MHTGNPLTFSNHVTTLLQNAGDDPKKLLELWQSTTFDTLAVNEKIALVSAILSKLEPYPTYYNALLDYTSKQDMYALLSTAVELRAFALIENIAKYKKPNDSHWSRTGEIELAYDQVLDEKTIKHDLALIGTLLQCFPKNLKDQHIKQLNEVIVQQAFKENDISFLSIPTLWLRINKDSVPSSVDQHDLLKIVQLFKIYKPDLLAEFLEENKAILGDFLETFKARAFNIKKDIPDRATQMNTETLQDDILIYALKFASPDKISRFLSSKILDEHIREDLPYMYYMTKHYPSFLEIIVARAPIESLQKYINWKLYFENDTINFTISDRAKVLYETLIHRVPFFVLDEEIAETKVKNNPKLCALRKNIKHIIRNKNPNAAIAADEKTADQFLKFLENNISFVETQEIVDNVRIISFILGIVRTAQEEKQTEKQTELWIQRYLKNAHYEHLGAPSQWADLVEKNLEIVNNKLQALYKERNDNLIPSQKNPDEIVEYHNRKDRLIALKFRLIFHYPPEEYNHLLSDVMSIHDYNNLTYPDLKNIITLIQNAEIKGSTKEFFDKCVNELQLQLGMKFNVIINDIVTEKAVPTMVSDKEHHKRAHSRSSSLSSLFTPNFTTDVYTDIIVGFDLILLKKLALYTALCDNGFNSKKRVAKYFDTDIVSARNSLLDNIKWDIHSLNPDMPWNRVAEHIVNPLKNFVLSIKSNMNENERKKYIETYCENITIQFQRALNPNSLSNRAKTRPNPSKSG